jgi:hypothetical protein
MDEQELEAVGRHVGRALGKHLAKTKYTLDQLSPIFFLIADSAASGVGEEFFLEKWQEGAMARAIQNSAKQEFISQRPASGSVSDKAKEATE